MVAYKSGDFASATVAVEKAIAENPRTARPLLLRGRIETSLKKYVEAEKDLKDALKMDHASNQGYYYLGELFFAQRDFEKAHPFYFNIAQLEPQNVDATLKLIYCDLGSKNLGEAARLTNAMDLFDDKHPNATFARAALARSEGKLAEADKLLQQAQTIYGAGVYSQYLPDYVFLFAKP